ncbi:glycosyl transferase [archaeon]|jgi:glycosyltransferase involved in cell wall biosynthesis|nr:glycosyl transferase [archaeon]MDP6548074.1 glycosyltransferase family 2 protein [Candidatus Woesearchaeota archaeon]|tara:strand:- start:688 stop:1386 length:699 start_codon:yes stop_codon:yes gene_type:complete
MKKLSIIIPVYDEEKTILDIIGKVKKVNLKNIKKEIVIVDDFSTDNTRKILEKLKDGSIKIFFHKKNQGKGTAIRTGLNHITGDIILIQDADSEYDPREYTKLLKPIIEDNKKVVYGTRLEYIKHNVKNMNRLHFIGNVFLTHTTNLLYNTKITDMETGYKVFKKEVIEKIRFKAKRFDFEPEITAKILKQGYKIYEVPITFKARKFNEGKKITWRDGIKALFYLIKYRFTD